MASKDIQKETETKLYATVKDLPKELWQDLSALDKQAVCRRAAVGLNDSGCYRVPFLGADYIVDMSSLEITTENEGRAPSFQAGLVLLSYLLNASDDGLSGRLVTEREIKGGDFFFRGPHALSKDDVLAKYASDKEGFLSRASKMGCSEMPMGDAAFRVLALPKILVAYTLYLKDDEFPASLTITFDASTDKHLPLDAVFALINVMSARLVR